MDNDSQQVKHKKYEVWQPFLLSAMMAIGILIGYKMNDKSDGLVTALDAKDKIEIGRVEEIIRLIETRYVDKVDRNKLIENAINGILDDLDPHTIYLEKEYVTDVNNHMEGNFRGIGIESHMLNDTAIIIKVVDKSPAYNAGLRQFDKIVKINNRNVAGIKMSFDTIKQMMKVSKDVVQLEILQHTTKKALIKNIKIDDIPIHSADISYLLNDSVGFIQIKQFSANTYNEFMAAFEDLTDKNKAKHLVIDLRGNPGGYLPQATKIVNQLIKEKKQIIVTTKDKNGNSEEYFTTGHSFFNIDKIAILVDEYSASGSEVIAGAIQDHDRGIIIGQTTFGKGLVQEQFNLSNGAAIRLTTARYYTPSGRSIQKNYEKGDSSKIDTSAYKTLYLGRTIYGGGGIKPDVLIDFNKPNHYDRYSLRNSILDFVLNKLLRQEIKTRTNIDYAKLTKEFINWNVKGKPISYQENEIDSALKDEINYLFSNGDDEVISIEKSKNDAFINAALSYITGKTKLK